MNQFLGLVTHEPVLFFIGSVLACSFVMVFIMALVLHWIMRYMSRKTFDKMADEYSGGIIKTLNVEIAANERMIERLQLENDKLKMAILKGQIALGMGEEG